MNNLNNKIKKHTINEPDNNSSLNIIDSPLFSNTPIIFKKKINKVVYKPLQYVFNDTGITRHYPPGAQE
jgi:hypothetical protein